MEKDHGRCDTQKKNAKPTRGGLSSWLALWKCQGRKKKKNLIEREPGGGASNHVSCLGDGRQPGPREKKFRIQHLSKKKKKTQHCSEESWGKGGKELQVLLRWSLGHQGPQKNGSGPKGASW